MVREDILGGLRSALARGQSIKQAMMSFYNSGYKKEEIEEAARVLYVEQTKMVSQQKSMLEKKEVKPSFFKRLFGKKKIPEEKNLEKKKETLEKEKSEIKGTEKEIPKKEKILEKSTIKKPVEIQRPYIGPKKVISSKQDLREKPLAPQRVSNYEQKTPKPKGKFVIILLVFILLILFGGLASVFLFKEELLRFLNSLI